MVALSLALPGSTSKAEPEKEAAILILEQANKVRAQQGAPPLKLDSRLAASALGHSQDMATRNYFEHDSPEGGTVETRVAREGVDPKDVDEILFRCSGRDPRVIAEASVQAWMKDPPHRRTLLNPRYKSAGVGVARQGGDFLVTMDFDSH